MKTAMADARAAATAPPRRGFSRRASTPAWSGVFFLRLRGTALPAASRTFSPASWARSDASWAPRSAASRSFSLASRAASLTADANPSACCSAVSTPASSSRSAPISVRLLNRGSMLCATRGVWASIGCAVRKGSLSRLLPVLRSRRPFGAARLLARSRVRRDPVVGGVSARGAFLLGVKDDVDALRVVALFGLGERRPGPAVGWKGRIGEQAARPQAALGDDVDLRRVDEDARAEIQPHQEPDHRRERAIGLV